MLTELIVVTVKVSRKEDDTNLKYFEIKLQAYWITVIYLLDTQILFQGCFLSDVRNDVSHLHIIIIIIIQW